MRLDGYDGRFGLRCWRGQDRSAVPEIVAADNEADLRAEADRRLAAGWPGRIELAVWNFELNDWVRTEVLNPG